MHSVALDATYSIGDGLSGVGLYSREILYGLAAAHPETRFDFWYRPHRFLRSWREALPGNARRRLLAGPLGPRGDRIFHGLNQRLPDILPRRSVATFHDLFVLTGEYSTAEFRERFAAQARDAAARADAVIAVSAFTRDQVVELLGVERAKIAVVHHGTRRLDLPAATRENIILCVGAIQRRKNITRLVEAFEAVDSGWRLVLAGSDGYGADEVRTRIACEPSARTHRSARIRIAPRSRRMVCAGARLRFSLSRRRFRHAAIGGFFRGASRIDVEPVGAARGGGRRGAPS